MVVSGTFIQFLWKIPWEFCPESSVVDGGSNTTFVTSKTLLREEKTPNSSQNRDPISRQDRMNRRCSLADQYFRYFRQTTHRDLYRQLSERSVFTKKNTWLVLDIRSGVEGSIWSGVSSCSHLILDRLWIWTERSPGSKHHPQVLRPTTDLLYTSHSRKGTYDP